MSQKNSIVTEKTEPDEYLIYQTVLKKAFIGSSTKQFLIRNLTSDDTTGGNPFSKTALIEPGEDNISVLPETFENYKAVNKKPDKLKDEFNIDVPVILLTEEELPEIFNKMKDDYASGGGDSYGKFMEQKYQTRYIYTLSNVGFSKDRNQALLHVEHLCRTTCGGGMYFFLVKENRNWIIKKRLPTWIS